LWDVFGRGGRLGRGFDRFGRDDQDDQFLVVSWSFRSCHDHDHGRGRDRRSFDIPARNITILGTVVTFHHRHDYEFQVLELVEFSNLQKRV